MAATRGALAGPRVLLRKLREVMAEPIGAQERLDKIVTLIAANMVAEVCSVYVLRADNVLELYATEGLKASSVHRATLTVGRGLVGLIAAEARPLNLPDAQAHPAFAYLPETGEEIYHSFLGVPVLRAGRTLGVLVVQNRSYRTYTEEEIEALQTTAMVLAEMFASGEMEDLSDPGRRPRRQPPGASEGRGLRRRHRARPCRAARAARRRHPAHRRGRRARAAAARCGDGEPPALGRRSSGARRRGRRRRASRDPRSLQDVRRGPRLDAAAAGGDPQRPHRRGGGRARAERHARPHGAADRPVPARPAARFRRSRQPAAARADGPAARALRRRPAGGRDHRRPQHGPGRAARLRPRAAARPGAGGGRRRPATSRSSRARSASPPSASSTTSSRWPRPATRSSSTATPARCISGRPPTSRPPMPTRCASAPAGRSSTGCSATSRRSRSDGVAHRAPHQCRPAHGHAASGGIRARPASASSAPSCSSWSRRASRGSNEQQALLSPGARRARTASR